MKCRKCGQRASFNMRHHKLALCKSHYLEWLPEQTERVIKKYRMFHRNDRVLVAVSGGKDSLALWDILWRLGCTADGIYINLGIDGGSSYSEESQHKCENFARERNLNLIIENIQEQYEKNIPDLAGLSRRGHQKPCAICGMVKRHVMNRVAHDGSYDVLVTGHNLDDEAATLLSNTMNWIPEYLVRQGPVLEAKQPGLVRKAKPLFRFYERETAAYALLRGIDYIMDECPFAEGTKSILYKQILNQMEADRPGIKLNFYLSYLMAKENGLFSPQADQGAEMLHACQVCGQPTSTPGECSFCRMIQKVVAA